VVVRDHKGIAGVLGYTVRECYAEKMGRALQEMMVVSG
jgi:hypothetical protein